MGNIHKGDFVKIKNVDYSMVDGEPSEYIDKIGEVMRVDENDDTYPYLVKVKLSDSETETFWIEAEHVELHSVPLHNLEVPSVPETTYDNTLDDVYVELLPLVTGDGAPTYVLSVSADSKTVHVDLSLVDDGVRAALEELGVEPR